MGSARQTLPPSAYLGSQRRIHSSGCTAALNLLGDRLFSRHGNRSHEHSRPHIDVVTAKQPQKSAVPRQCSTFLQIPRTALTRGSQTHDFRARQCVCYHANPHTQWCLYNGFGHSRYASYLNTDRHDPAVNQEAKIRKTCE